jgi:hypothetical protein
MTIFRGLYADTKLIPWMYVRYALVLYAAVCHYCRLCVYVPGVPVLVKYGQISPGQELQAHTTDNNNIWPHTVNVVNMDRNMYGHVF